MNKNEEKISFSKILKDSRLSKEIDLQIISDDLKINIKYLEAIENGDLDIVPNTYIRLFIRAYAKYLKLDSKEILSNYESKNNIKNKNIFKNIMKGNIKEKNKENLIIKPMVDIQQMMDDVESGKIRLAKKDGLKDNNHIEEQKIIFKGSKIKEEVRKFNLSEKYFVEPKKIISSISIIILLLLIYLLISYLSNQQKNTILNNNTDNTLNLNTQNISLVDNKLLSSNNFNQNNLIEKKSYKLRYNIELPYKFQIVTKEKTKLYISYDENGSRIEECNIIADKGTLINLTKDDNIYFDLWNAKHVEIAIDNKSITKYLDKNDYIIRGSFKPSDKLLYLEFYKY